MPKIAELSREFLKAREFLVELAAKTDISDKGQLALVRMRPEDKTQEMALDSLDWYDIFGKFEEETGQEVTDREMGAIKTGVDLVALIQKKRKNN
ncbi:MAG: hypothetical protein NT019_00075 [Candidatus Adlerbacteria bacterium]|nr:hypothetical protein [Candidatus Adlerbacteria bacterium]